MPDVIRVPSIWDYLSGGLSKGIGSYGEARDRVRAQQAQQAGLMSTLFNQGAIDNTDLMPALDAVGVKAKIKPNQAQQQRQILSSPTINPATGQPWTDDERKLAGLPSLSDTMESSAKYKYLTGGQIDDRTAAVLKLPTDLEIEQGKALSQDKTLSTIGPRYVDLAITQTGGVNAKNLNTVVDRAFSQYTADRRRAGLPVDPSHRSFFASQAVDRMKQQEQLDIQRINANKQYSGGGGFDSHGIQMYNALGKTVVEANNAAETLRKDAILGMKIANVEKYGAQSPYANDDGVGKYFAAVQQAQTALQQQQALQIQMGMAPPSGVAAPVPTAQPRPTAGPAPTIGREKVLADAIISGQATLENASDLFKKGKITAAEYKGIKNILAQSGKYVYKRTP